jgi:hypothetical protein
MAGIGSVFEWLQKISNRVLASIKPSSTPAPGPSMQKIDDYKKYWNEIAIPDYDDFVADLDNLRKAFHCAGSLFHMADWLYWGNKTYIEANFTWLDGNRVTQPVRDEKTFANAVRDLHPDFELIRNIANAGKHLEIRRGKHAASPVSAANTYVSSTGYGIGGYGMGPWGGTPRVRQEGPGGSDLELSDLAKSVRDMWISLCATHNLPLT